MFLTLTMSNRNNMPVFITWTRDARAKALQNSIWGTVCSIKICSSKKVIQISSHDTANQPIEAHAWMKYLTHQDYFVKRTFLLFVCFDLHCLPYNERSNVNRRS